MAFIGRHDELDFLESCYASPKAQLVVLYGRRRVGKTETLLEFVHSKPHLFFAAQSATKQEQLAAFSQIMFGSGSPASRYLTQYSDWTSALRDLTELPAERSDRWPDGTTRRLLIIDEFPYLVASDHSLPSVLQNLWDHTLRHGNVMIVLCGSAMSFIEKEVLSEKAPLYGRATGILKMQPMPYYDAAQFLPNHTPRDQLLTYAALGGIPHYLAQFAPEDDFETNVKQRILKRGTTLYSETEFLMQQEFRETATYNSIIQAIALGATHLNEIAQKTLLGAQKASTYLANLMEVGIVEREFPVTASLSEYAKGMRGLYRLSDNFFRFWYAFVFANRSALETGDVDGVYRYEMAPRLNDFAAMPFGRVCAAWLWRENMRGALPFRAHNIGRWWNKTDEIDVVAADRGFTSLILGECKFRNGPVDGHVLADLRGKSVAFRKADRQYYLFSASGFTDSLTAQAQADGAVRLVDAATLYADATDTADR